MLRGRKDARGIKERYRGEEEVNGQIRWAEGGVFMMKVHKDDAEGLDKRDCTVRIGCFLMDNPIREII